MFSYYGIFTWLPSLLLAKGFTLREALWLNLAIAVFQIPGYYAAAALVDRLGRKPTLVAFLACAAIGSFFFAGATLAAQPSVAAVIGWGAVIAFFNLGAWGVTYTYTPEQYPTAIRASGAGLAAGAGRLVGAFAPAHRRRDAGPVRLAVLGVRRVRVRDAGGALVVLVLGDETRGRSSRRSGKRAWRASRASRPRRPASVPGQRIAVVRGDITSRPASTATRSTPRPASRSRRCARSCASTRCRSG